MYHNFPRPHHNFPTPHNFPAAASASVSARQCDGEPPCVADGADARLSGVQHGLSQAVQCQRADGFPSGLSIRPGEVRTCHRPGPGGDQRQVPQPSQHQVAESSGEVGGFCHALV